MNRILIVDDEADICAILKYNLDKAGYLTDTAYSAEEALKLGVEGYDLLLLDIMMGEMSGIDLARTLRSRNVGVPIIFISAKDTVKDRIEGLDIGADDYIPKPFSMAEVLSRVKAVLRRSSRRQVHKLEFKGLVLDTVSKTVSSDGKAVQLTKTEFETLSLLLGHPGKVFSREEILQSVWPGDVIVIERTVDVTINRLRHKIGPYGANIATRHGYGYSFDNSDERK